MKSLLDFKTIVKRLVRAHGQAIPAAASRLCAGAWLFALRLAAPALPPAFCLVAGPGGPACACRRSHFFPVVVQVLATLADVPDFCRAAQHAGAGLRFAVAVALAQQHPRAKALLRIVIQLVSRLGEPLGADREMLHVVLRRVVDVLTVIPQRGLVKRFL